MAAIQDLDATPPAVILPPHSSPGFFSAASTPPADAARPDRTCCCRHPEPEPASVPGDSAHYRSRIARCPRRVPGVLLAEPGDLNLARPPGPFPGLTTRGSSRSRRPARTRRSTGRRGNGTAGPRRTSSQPTARRLRPGPPPARRLPAPAVPSPDTRQRAGPPPAPGWEAAGLPELCGYPRRHRRRPRTDRLRGRDPRWALPECSLRPFNGSWTGRAGVQPVKGALVEQGDHAFVTVLAATLVLAEGDQFLRQASTFEAASSMVKRKLRACPFRPGT